MKNLKILFLSLGLLILGVLFFYENTKAAPVNVSLEVLAGTVSCSNDTAFGALGTVSSSFSAQYKAGTGVAAGSATGRTCTDHKGNTTWTNTGISVLMTNNLSGSAAGTYIANSNVTMKADTPSYYNNSNPACTAVTDISTASNINTQKYVLRKTGVQGSVCTISTRAYVYVTIPGSTPVGTYSGTVTVDYPS